jgi:hypothetical protein
VRRRRFGADGARSVLDFSLLCPALNRITEVAGIPAEERQLTAVATGAIHVYAKYMSCGDKSCHISGKKKLAASRLYADARTASRGSHCMFGIAMRLLPVL